MPSQTDDWHQRQQPPVDSNLQNEQTWIQPEKLPSHSLRYGSPFMVSGELFVRSTPQLFDRDIDSAKCSSSARTVHPSRGLLFGVSTELRDLLLCPLDPSHAEHGDGNARILSLASREQKSSRLRRIQQLEVSKRVAACISETRLSSVRKSVNRLRRDRAGCLVRLDMRLSSLVLRHAAMMRNALAGEHSKMVAEAEHCRQEEERLELAARLASLAATADYRTRGRVVLRRLPPTHPQHARCLRAATENVKADFFAAESPYGAIRVLDIYKIENRFLLEKFQRAAETTKQCRVKGLFCHVPLESIEHVVMFGVGPARDAEDTSAEGDDLTQTYGSLWPDYMDPLQALVGLGRRGGGVAGADSPGLSNQYAKSNGRHERPLQFPRPFSRHSTLEEERSHANGVGWRTRTESLNELGDATVGRSSGGPEQSRRAASEPRVLALCRVMIGSMYVSPEPLSSYYLSSRIPATPEEGSDLNPSTGPAAPKALPCPLPSQGEFDTMYFPKEEEYLLLKERFVLPEFLVLHRFVPRRPLRSPSEKSRAEGKDGAAASPSTEASESCREQAGSSDSKLFAPVASEPAASVVAAMKAAMMRREEDTGAGPAHEKGHSGRSSARINEPIPDVRVLGPGLDPGPGDGRDRLRAVEGAIASAFVQCRQEVAMLRAARAHEMESLASRSMPRGSEDEPSEGAEHTKRGAGSPLDGL